MVNCLSAWLSFMLLVPGIVPAQHTVHNAIAVFFPAWVSIGTNRPRGVDAAEQRLLLLLGNWLGLRVALITGVLVIALLSLTLRRSVGPVVLPIGALVTTLAVCVEVWAATDWLGRAWNQLDVTSVDGPDWAAMGDWRGASQGRWAMACASVPSTGMMAARLVRLQPGVQRSAGGRSVYFTVSTPSTISTMR